MDVLVDFSPLETSRRFHGIGSYVRSLGMALAALDEHERRGLDIRALWQLGGERAVGSLVYGRDEAPLLYPKDVPWFLRRRSELVWTMLRLRPKLFHSTQPFGAPRGSFVPRVVTCHDILPIVLEHDYLRGPWIYRRALRLADALRYRQARRIIAISKHTADDLVRILGISAGKIDVVPHGVNHEKFRPASGPEEEAAGAEVRKRLGVDRAPYFLFVGAADPRKNAPLLVSAFAAAALSGVELVFAGRLAPAQRATIDAAIERAGRPLATRFLGFVKDEDIVPLLHGALALVFPSTYEGFGLPVLEAMAAGCPVVTTHATSLKEVAADAALITEPGDERSLCDGLRSVANDAALRAELRAKGIFHAARFSWKRAAMATVDCYVRALG